MEQPRTGPSTDGAHRIAVIGSGYVGSVVAACFASVGHQVVAIESDQAKLAQLEQGLAPFHEPGLNELLLDTLRAGSLSFTADIATGLESAQVVFVCVGTPPGPDGRPDMSAMSSVARSIAASAEHDLIIVTKSTVPIGTGRWLRTQILEHVQTSGRDAPALRIVSNPEFLREGQSVKDFFHPDRVVLGSDDADALDVIADIYEPILSSARISPEQRPERIPLLRCDLATGEMAKYASNAFLATKISFANEIARLCDYVGADVESVTEAMGYDKRIGAQFLRAGIGWGGSCLGKDLAALAGTASDHGYRPLLLEAAMEINDGQRQFVVDELERQLRDLRSSRIALLGLAFKPGTDDLRDSPAIDIAERLIARGAEVAAYDPMVKLANTSGIRACEDAYGAARGVDAVVIANECPEFIELNLSTLLASMRNDVLIDGRNLFDPATARAAGFRYVAIGRPGIGQTASVELMPEPKPGN